MNKNVLIVFVIILTPIIVLGLLAVTGAENFEKQKEAYGHNDDHNTTESAAIMVPTETVKSVYAPSIGMLGLSGLRIG